MQGYYKVADGDQMEAWRCGGVAGGACRLIHLSSAPDGIGGG